MMTSPSIWTYSESLSAANEMTFAADEIAGTASGASVTVVEVDKVREGVSSTGRKLVLKSAKPMEGSSEMVAEALFRAIRSTAGASSPSLILIGATRRGKEVASRLAVKMNVGCLSELVGLTMSEQEASGERTVYGGKMTAKVSCTLPCVATLKTNILPRRAPRQGEVGAVDEQQVGDLEPRVRLVSSSKKKEGTVDIRSAKVIVAAGRGIKQKEDLALVQDLAAALHGVIGCSRPLSSDLGWLPEDYHIGLTGIAVHPDLYLALGISGQLQHIAGIKDSKIIAAINTDKDAPIFQASDYGIVGDLYQIVPAIIKLVSG
jgi:electron transfer flavoprotein alpha subunit